MNKKEMLKRLGLDHQIDVKGVEEITTEGAERTLRTAEAAKIRKEKTNKSSVVCFLGSDLIRVVGFWKQSGKDIKPLVY